MKEVKVSPEELKNIIDNSKMIGKGFFGTVFTYKDKLIKLDKSLFRLLNLNDKRFARDVVEDHYKFDDLVEDFSDLDQLDYLSSKQKDVKRTKFPTGFISMKGVSPRIYGVSPGIIIPYHRNHQELKYLSKEEYIKILNVLKNLLLAVKELADNEIAHEDLVVKNKKDEYNILYQGETPQIIDVSGELICAGDYFKNAREMYRELGKIIYNFTNNVVLLDSRPQFSSFEENKELLDEYERRIKK